MTLQLCNYSQMSYTETFRFHHPHEMPAAKYAHIWSIENVWAINKQDLAKVFVTTIPEMKKKIIKV